MPSFTTLLAASALILTASSSPILSIRSTCGSTPSGSTSQTSLSQPTGITTASACQAKCSAMSACQSFVFGMVNNVDECMLYSVAASSIPKQASTNLIVYDKACTSVPAVVPTASNPTGAATSSSNTNTGTTSGNTNANHRLAIRDTCGSTPTSTTSQTVLEQPTGITTAEQCQAKCAANTSCKSFVFGMVNSVDECMLYSVAASAVPMQTSSNLVVYDVACASVPAQTPTAANPTGKDTSSTSGSTTTGSTGPSGSGGSAGTAKGKAQ